MKLCALAVLLLYMCACAAGSNPDAITFLPGLTKQPSFDQYSGYLAANGGRMLHYWFVASQSSAKSDPLIVWTNGGPGCSSMLGILTENGPFTIQDDGVNLVYNDNSWNKFANVLYIESPAGVGFSYAPDDNVTTDDNQITDDHFTALIDFYKKYPDFKANKLFLIGESYSGVYTPLLAAKVMSAIDEGSLTVTFGGFAAGNGVTNYNMSSNSLISLLYFHGIIGQRVWEKLVQSCCNGLNDCNFNPTSKGDCATYVSYALETFMTSGINQYNILADCAGFTPHKMYSIVPELEILYRGSPVAALLKKKLMQSVSGLLTDTPPCLNYTSLTKYLNNPYVKTALHISTSAPDSWTPCSVDVGQKYHRIYNDMAQTYISMLNNLGQKIRILVYNGDLDTACNFLGNQWFVDNLGAEDEVAWRPWIYSDGSEQIAGFIKEYSKIAFATVKGAGHMAPEDKPIATSLLIQNFVTGKPF